MAGYATTRTRVQNKGKRRTPPRGADGKFRKRASNARASNARKRTARKRARRRTSNPRRSVAYTRAPSRRRSRRRTSNPSRRRGYRARRRSRNPSFKLDPMLIGLTAVGVAGGGVAGGVLMAYLSPHLARFGTGAPAALANGLVGAGLLGVGVYAYKKAGKYRIPVVATFVAMAVPWILQGVRELGLFRPDEAAAAEQAAAEQAAAEQAAAEEATAQGWGMHGFRRGRIPGAVRREYMAGLSRGRIPGAVGRMYAPRALARVHQQAM